MSWPPASMPLRTSGFRFARAAYRAAVYPAGPEPMTITSRTSTMALCHRVSERPLQVLPSEVKDAARFVVDHDDMDAVVACVCVCSAKIDDEVRGSLLELRRLDHEGYDGSIWGNPGVHAGHRLLSVFLEPTKVVAAVEVAGRGREPLVQRRFGLGGKSSRRSGERLGRVVGCRLRIHGERIGGCGHGQLALCRLR